MMTVRIALCIDELTLHNPHLAGLDGEALDAHDWLAVHSAGEEARASITADEHIEEVWVVSCDDVEPINLAAAIKDKRPDVRVSLVTFNGDGSLFSRAHTAGIDEVLEKTAFVNRYAHAKADFASRTAQHAAPARALSPQAPAAVSPSPQDAALAQAPRAALAVARQPSCFIMPVVSGSGGSGKSTVSVVAAFTAQQMGYRTALLDFDLQFGDVAVMAGAENPLTADTAVSRPELLEAELRKQAGPTIIAAPARLEAAERVIADAPALIERLADAFDVIIANTGAAWAEQHAVLLERSTAALFLVDQRPSSVRACKHALELCARCGIATGPFRFALNRCAKGAPLSSIDVSCALQGAPVFELKEGGREVEELLGAGAVSDFLESGNQLTASVSQMMEQLIPGGRLILDAQAEPAERRSSRRRGRHVGRKRGWSR